MVWKRLIVVCAAVLLLSQLAGAAGKSPADALLAKLRALGPQARAKTVQTMAAAKNPTLIRPLVALLADADTPFATTTKINGVTYLTVLTTALRGYGDAAVTPLVDALGTIKSGSKRDLLIAALGDTGSQRAIKPLMDLVRRAPAGEARGVETERIGAALRKFGDPGMKALTALLRELSNDREACIALCRSLLDAGSRAQAYLAPLIRDPKVGSYARWALQEIGPQVMPLAISLLKDPEHGVQQWAARTLIKWADARAMPYIIELLSHPDPEIRMEAAYAFGANTLLSNHGAVPEAAIEPLVTLLQDPDPGVRQAATWTLHGVRDPRVIAGFRLLVNGLNATDATRAALALAQMKDPEATAFLLSLADVVDHPARNGIVLALAYANDPRGTQALLARLADPDPHVRNGAMMTLAELRNTNAIAPLAETVLQDTNWTARAAAARALGYFTDPKAIDALLVARKDTDRNVRIAASESLGRTNDPRAIASLLNALTVVHERDIALLGLCQSTTPRAVEKLLAFAKGKDGTLRHIALQGLGNSGSPAAVPALIAALKDPRERYFGLHKIAPLRAEAAHGLGKLRDRRAVPALLAALTDPHPDVAASAASALTAITGQSFGYDTTAWHAWWKAPAK
ncbi:MAG: HEAT repeat domain-containing protein [Armatimonadota bacterium]